MGVVRKLSKVRMTIEKPSCLRLRVGEVSTQVRELRRFLRERDDLGCRQFKLLSEFTLREGFGRETDAPGNRPIGIPQGNDDLPA